MFVNILQLTFSIYMLQVYDKVLTSYNLSTLAVITLAAVICLVVLALLEWIRSRLLVRAGIAFDNMLSATVLGMNLKHAAAVPGGAGSRGNLRDVQQLRNFLGGNAVFAFFDLPWMPIYFALIFVLHPALGWVAVGGGIIVFILGVLTERLTRTRLENATRLNAMAAGFTGAALRNASIVRAMGMVGHVTARWRRLNDAVIGLQTRASHKAGLLRAVSKSLRTGLQVAIYAVGAYLTVMHESTAGVMIAASIVMGRALAPIDQAMATYKQSLDARSSYNHLKELLDTPPAPPSMDLPAPAGERNRARALQKDYEDAMAGARTDVIKAMLDMDAARELITTTRYGVDSARENYAMSQKRYMTNIGTITDLVDAQVRLTEAERDASRALADYHSARARFYFNIGQENPGLK